MKILISNDDGIKAAGIKILEEIALDFADEVVVVAPDLNMSGTGHSMTFQYPLRLTEYDSNHYSVNGTPTDSVVMAMRHIMPTRPDFVFSGINCDSNLAEDVTYSGTIGAAMEGTLFGIPSIAFSQEIDSFGNISWDVARFYAPIVLDIILKKFRFDSNTFLNINFPAVEVSDVKGIKITKQGMREIDDVVVKSLDPRGLPYFWMGPAGYRHNNKNSDIETDLGAVNSGYVSITPVSLDMTGYSTIEKLRSMF